MPEFAIGSGASFVQLANEVSDAMARAMRERGMEADEACSVVATVAADHARMNYGNEYLAGLAQIILNRANHPEPQPTGEDIGDTECDLAPPEQH